MANDLYHQRILELAATDIPELDDPDGVARIDNPLCGDRVDAQVRIDGEKILAAGFKVRGCRLCEASAALIADHSADLDLAEWQKIADQFEAMVRDGASPPDGFAGAEAFQPVHGYKSRHDCPLLPAQALNAAIASAKTTPSSD